MDNMKLKYFKDINLQDAFFDSLRENYNGFDTWFSKKAESNEKAYTYYVNDELKDFLYVKPEKETIKLDNKELPAINRLKVGTFKIERRGTNRGERFIKKILDIAVSNAYSEVYVTMFDDTEELAHLRHFFEKYGFVEVGRKTHSNLRSESVLLRNLNTVSNDITKDYPYINKSDKSKYVLSIYPEFHTRLFSDSILNNEDVNIVKDVSPTNSIYKIYITAMKGVDNLKRGDLVAIYRSNDYKGAAKYRSVVTSVCTIDEVKNISDFTNEEEFIRYTIKYSIFTEVELRNWYKSKRYPFIVRMLYNVPFTRKVIKKSLAEDLNLAPSYWGFFKLTDEQFNRLLQLGQVNERYIID